MKSSKIKAYLPISSYLEVDPSGNSILHYLFSSSLSQPYDVEVTTAVFYKIREALAEEVGVDADIDAEIDNKVTNFLKQVNNQGQTVVHVC